MSAEVTLWLVAAGSVFKVLNPLKSLKETETGRSPVSEVQGRNVFFRRCLLTFPNQEIMANLGGALE